MYVSTISCTRCLCQKFLVDVNFFSQSLYQLSRHFKFIFHLTFVEDFIPMLSLHCLNGLNEPIIDLFSRINFGAR